MGRTGLMALQRLLAVAALSLASIAEAEPQTQFQSREEALAALAHVGRTAEANKVTEHAEFLPDGEWTERSDIGVAAEPGGAK